MLTSQPRGYPLPVRDRETGEHPFLSILPVSPDSPAIRLVQTDEFSGSFLLKSAIIKIVEQEGYCWVDDTVPCIVLTSNYYKNGSDFDLYLDLIHELTHIRQVFEGKNIWDESLPYHRRPTEIEGYAVAVAECHRLGVAEEAIIKHLSNPWMDISQINELFMSISAFLAQKRIS